MLDDFNTAIQSDEIAEIINYNDQLDNTQYVYEED